MWRELKKKHFVNRYCHDKFILAESLPSYKLGVQKNRGRIKKSQYITTKTKA